MQDEMKTTEVNLVKSFFNVFGLRTHVHEIDGRHRLTVQIDVFLHFGTRWWPNNELCYEDAWRSIIGHDFELYDLLRINNPHHPLMECSSEAELVLKLTALGQTGNLEEKEDMNGKDKEA